MLTTSYLICIDDKKSFINLINNIKTGFNINYIENTNYKIINSKKYKEDKVKLEDYEVHNTNFKIYKKTYDLIELKENDDIEAIDMFKFIYEFVENYESYTLSYKAESLENDSKDKLQFFEKIINLENIDSNYISKYYIEVKINNTQENQIIENIVQKINSILYNIIKYNNTVGFLYKLFNISNKKTLKGFTNQVFTLSKNKFINNVLPFINNYYITEKLDGIRCICVVYGDTHIELVADNVYNIKEFYSDKNNNDVSLILDCELIINKPYFIENDNYIFSINDIEIKVFDLLFKDLEYFVNKPFEVRLEKLLELEQNKKTIKTLDFYSIKNYVKLSKNNYHEQIDNFYKDMLSKNIKNDGIIFAPTSEVFYKHFTNKKIMKVNENYYSMITFKWKPLDKITIDFYIVKSNKKNDNNKTNYILCSGVNEYDFKNLNLNLHEDYYQFIPNKYHNMKYFPIQFYTNEKTDLYNFESKDSNLHNKIGEFLYINSEWVLMKIREDRTKDLSMGTNYGNDIKFARDNFYSIINPLTLEMMISKDDTVLMKDIYFKKSDATYEGLRKFNSNVKQQLFKYISYKFLKNKYKDIIVDLCSGKGQDIYKISNLNFKTNVFIDVNQTAIDELNNRLQNIKITNSKYIVYTLDLFSDFRNIRKQIMIKNSANLISMNFAIHYFLKNQLMLENIISLMSTLASRGTFILLTCLNGSKIFEKLQNNDEYCLHDNNIKKYSIKKKYKSKFLTALGQKIDIMLPFSNTEYYEEYLVNIDYLVSEFERFGFKTVLNNSFDYYLQNSKINLSESDIEFVKNYSYIVLKKY